MEIIRLTFGESCSVELQLEGQQQVHISLSLNKGQLTENEAKAQYKETLGLTDLECERLFYYVKQTQIKEIEGLIEESNADLLNENANKDGKVIPTQRDLLAGIVAKHYAKARAIVSAEVGLLKPQREIYLSLLSQYDLNAAETIFIDDMLYNVQGAESVGIKGIQFESAFQCEQALKSLGVQL
ncbi:HAD-IA family hydrolase [Vibrio metschnikovii]|uniref:HAD-IA family hydrolase n=1 Tax=Vibrio metschnikovii TaxID=28172 RepID=UPI002FCB80F4